MRLLAALLVLAPGLARAGALVGVSAGGFFPQPFSDLGSALVVGVEGGWSWGAAAVSVTLDAAQPSSDGRAGDASYALRARELRLAALAQGRLRLGALVPFASAGPALFLIETRESGSVGGTAFGPVRERSLELGLVAAAGLEAAVGPGALYGAAELSFAGLGQLVTGDSSAGALILRCGYRVPL